MAFLSFRFRYWKFFTTEITVPVRTRDLDAMSVELIFLRLQQALKTFGVTMIVVSGDAKPST